MICLSFVQGRLSKKIGSKFQYFPINNWQNEMPIARKIGFKHIEWIISDYNNPIFNKIFQNQILQVLKENKISISSIGLDFLMREPLFKIHNDDLEWILLNLKNILKRFKAKRVNIPIEENSRLSNHFDYKIVKKRLHKIIKILGGNTKISIESDLSLKNLDHLLSIKELKKLGILLDIGNIKADGFSIEDYISKFAKKIYGIHVKKRGIFFKKSEKINKPYHELRYVINNISKLTNLNDITLQSFRSNSSYINELKLVYKIVKKEIEKINLKI